MQHSDHHTYRPVTRSQSAQIPQDMDDQQQQQQQPQQRQASSSGQGATAAPTQNLVTLIKDESTLPLFNGKNIPVHNFLTEVDAEIARRGATDDKTKISILTSRIDKHGTLAGFIIHADAFIEINTYAEFVDEFKKAFDIFEPLGAFSTIYSVGKELNHPPYQHKDQSVSVATSVKTKLREDLVNSQWVTNGMMSVEYVVSMVAYLVFISKLHPETLRRVGTSAFKPDVKLSRFARQFPDSDKVTEEIESQTTPITRNHMIAQVTQATPPITRSRHASRTRHQSRHRSPSRTRKFCNYCRKVGHTDDICYRKFPSTPNKHCSYHGRCFHSSDRCRVLRSQSPHNRGSTHSARYSRNSSPTYSRHASPVRHTRHSSPGNLSHNSSST
ncbi:uncharacterized protein LOC143029500 [Oratosquilla oratoria]|uniref:uncharacterized protein LOC143029500 n=1 Tax=Oratosquilla oratoria TaxID=337810 RepID=UPI003F765BD0